MIIHNNKYKPTIFCIVGKSGSGKSIIANYISEEFGIQLIESRTNRPKRCDDEIGHTFVSNEEFESYKLEDMIAYTNFGDYRYCCLINDVKDTNVYVIDELGIMYLNYVFGDIYNIVSIYIDRKDENIDVDENRRNRDKKRITLPKYTYDHWVENNYSKELLFVRIKAIIELEVWCTKFINEVLRYEEN